MVTISRPLQHLLFILMLLSLAPWNVEAFVSNVKGSRDTNIISCCRAQWRRHWIRSECRVESEPAFPKQRGRGQSPQSLIPRYGTFREQKQDDRIDNKNKEKIFLKIFSTLWLLVSLTTAMNGALPSYAAVAQNSNIASTSTSGSFLLAVSGGGFDFANQDITGADFANGNYKGKDFTQVIAKGTNFAKSNLQGCRFYKAYLVNTDFSGSDLRGASLEDTRLDNAIFKDANAAGAYFGSSIVDSKSLENADFTDAQIPSKALKLLCDRDDVQGVNPTTGSDTRESLLCP